MADEEWRPVEGWPYKVSNRGRVRRSEPARGTWKGRVLSPAADSYGYPMVVLHNDGEKKTVAVHRLVARAFIGPRPDRHEVDHINGDRSDNRASNLRYVPQHKNVGSDLSEEQINEIRDRAASGESSYSIAEDFPLDPPHVRRIVRGERFAWA